LTKGKQRHRSGFPAACPEKSGRECGLQMGAKDVGGGGGLKKLLLWGKSRGGTEKLRP